MELVLLYHQSPQVAIPAELTCAHSCAAAGIRAQSTSPILLLCRKLIAAGFGPDQPLLVYRGGTLALTIRSIGEGAGLTVVERPSGPAFEKWRPFSTAAIAPLARQNGEAVP